jgi:beta-N-acetylhexosaminidase
MPAVGRYGTTADTIEMLLKDQRIGGVLLLNGTKDEFGAWTKRFNHLNKEVGALPFLYSADAEPSLVNRKMKGSTEVKKAVEIASIEEVQAVAQTISDDLNAVGVNYNFAPVVDVAKNATVGYRGFGSDPLNIVPFCQAFIRTTQQNNIIATAKHFPGHGLVSGDTHKSLQVIDGELKELSNYPPLIQDSVLSIMIAHIAVKNNELYDTEGMPATTSRRIVSDLLRDSLGFNGLIVTDAMNMGGVVNVENAYSKAIAAGCDILLMPVNSFKAHDEILKEYDSNAAFRFGVDASVKRIIRMKIALGLI